MKWAQLMVVLVPFLCANPHCYHPGSRRASPGSPVRVAVQVGLCERTDCGEREALRLIEERPGIAV